MGFSFGPGFDSPQLHDGLLPTTPPKEWFFFHSPHDMGDAARSSLDQNSLRTTLGGGEKCLKGSGGLSKLNYERLN